MTLGWADRRPGSPQTASFFRDFLSTTAAQAVSLAMNALSLAVISRRLGMGDLGLYTLERRAMSLVQPFVLLGLGVAVTRYVATTAVADPRRAFAHAASGQAMIVVLALLIGALILAFPEPVAEVTFGDEAYADLARALAGFVVVTACFQGVYSVSRGYLHFLRANLLEIWVVGVCPLLLALLGPTDIVTFMWTLNGGILLGTLVVAVSEFPSRLGSLRRARADLRDSARSMLTFGLARTPGDIAIVALFAIPPIAVVHWGSVVEAGQVSVVVSSISLVAVVAVPLGVILLPRVAVDAAGASGIHFSKYVLLGEATFDMGLAICGLAFAASPLVIEFWLAETPPSVVTGMQVAALGLPGYVFYLAFRSYLDAVDTRPLSSFATLSGLVLLLITLPLALGVTDWPVPASAAAALSLSLTLAGVATYALAHRRIPGFALTGGIWPLVVWFVATLALGLAVRDRSLLVVAVSVGGAALALLAVLALSRRRWSEELRRRASEARGAV